MAEINPFSKRIVPFSITPFVTVWMVAPWRATGSDWGGTVIRTCALVEDGDTEAVAAAARVRAATPPARERTPVMAPRFVVVMVSYSRVRVRRIRVFLQREDGLDELGTLPIDLLPHGRVLLEGEVAPAVYPGLLGSGELREGLPLQMTKSASLPVSSEPTRSSMATA